MSKMEIVPELRDEYVSKDGHRLLKKDIMRMIRRKKIFVESPDGAQSNVTSKDFEKLFELLWLHLDNRIGVVNLMNSADQGPGGFVRYPLHSRAADLMNNGKWDDLIKFENYFDTFYPDADCPFRVNKRTPDKHVIKVTSK